MKNTIMSIFLSLALLVGLVGCNDNQLNMKNKKEVKQETYVLVHSAWFGASSFDLVKKELESKGHKVVTFDLPGHGDNTTSTKDITMDTYVKATQKVIDAQDSKVILVGHGLSGTVISATAETRSDKVKSLVYLGAMLVKNGTSFLDTVASVKTSVTLNNLVFSEDKNSVIVAQDKLHEAFGADIHLSPEPTAPLGARIHTSDDKFGTIPRYYIQTLNDNTIPSSVQSAMYTNMGVDKLYTINDSSHLVILSHPTLVADILDNVSQQARLSITSSEKSELLKAIFKASNTWKNGFNTGKASQCASIYSVDAEMNAKPFGTFKGRDTIEKFWDNLIKGGYSNVEYINATIDIIDEKHAIIASSWKMNKAKGIITKELFELQDDGSAKLISDNFEVQ